MIINKNYENLNVLHENTLENRAYYIPSSPMTSLNTESCQTVFFF